MMLPRCQSVLAKQPARCSCTGWPTPPPFCPPLIWCHARYVRELGLKDVVEFKTMNFDNKEHKQPDYLKVTAALAANVLSYHCLTTAMSVTVH